MKNKNAIIVCQASHEVINVLSIIEKIIDKYENIIIASNTVDSYELFLRNFNFPFKYLTWKTPYFDPIRPWTWISFYKSLKDDVHSIRGMRFDVYYTCVCDFHLLCRFKMFGKGTNFYYRPGAELKLVGIKGLPKLPFYRICYAQVKKIIQEIYSNSMLEFVNNGAIYNFRFLPEKMYHNILPVFVDNGDIVKKYAYRYSNNNSQTAIIFTEPYRNNFQSKQNYIETNKAIVNHLHNLNYSVVMKGHPRIGVCKEIEDMVDFIIPSYIPSEFIYMKDYKFAIGFVSTSLCSSCKDIATFSVINICDITDEIQAENWRQYLIRNSKNSIEFIRSLNDIK